MKLIQTLVLFALTADVAMGQLTVEQKVADFQNIAGLYAKRYAPYEWKRDIFGFDLLNAAPFMPHAADVSDISTVVFRRPDSQLDTYRIPWVKSGLAANQEGRLVTKPLPLCSPSLTRTPATDQAGSVIAYFKPLV